VINCGDLTQRARCSQFRAAREFLARLPQPQLTVPGNHDIPLFDLFRRFLCPVARYRRFISPGLNPLWHDDELLVQGINTARSLTWKNGRISCAQMELLERSLAAADRAQLRMIVTHHPFIPPPGVDEGSVQLVGRAQHALTVLDRGHADLLLAGHLHHGYTGDVRTFYPGTNRSMLVVQAGTAISRRVRSEPNAFNVLTLERNFVGISIRVWNGTTFVETRALKFRHEGDEWVAQ
jgi:3',5'-cyclic AMP phosphodiesterase CpdA